MANPANDRSADYYNKRVGGTTTKKPHTPACPATIGSFSAAYGNMGINPSKTPCSSYKKKCK